MLFKEIVDGRTDRRRTPDIEGSQKLTEHFVLRWAKNINNQSINMVYAQTSHSQSAYHTAVRLLFLPNSRIKHNHPALSRQSNGQNIRLLIIL